MSIDLEGRLDRAGEALPHPTEAARLRARAGALAALIESAPAPPPPARASPRRRIRLAGVTATLAFVVAASVVLVAPWEGASPLATERALAAIGGEPVVHAVVEDSRPYATIIDLSSGRERPQIWRTEYWYDGDRGLLRARNTVDDVVVTELLWTRQSATSSSGASLGPLSEPRINPALAGFAGRYREALESGRAEVVGETSVDGSDAILLRITVDERGGKPLYEEVAVDADSYRPLQFRIHLADNAAPWWRVVAIETIARDERHFTAPAPAEPQPQAQTGSDERVVTPTEAATSLERPAVWPGPTIAGIELTKIEALTLTTLWTKPTLWTNTRKTEGRALRLQYGLGREAGGSARWLEIKEGASLEAAPRFGSGAGPAIPAGHLQLFGFGDSDGSAVDRWLGSLQTHGVYVTLESTEREVVLAAARAMGPMR